MNTQYLIRTNYKEISMTARKELNALSRALPYQDKKEFYERLVDFANFCPNAFIKPEHASSDRVATKASI